MGTGSQGHPADIAHVALLAEVQRLQKALYFWLPQVPKSDPIIAKRAGDDAMLLVGWAGPADATAEDLGWVRLRDQPT